MRTQLLLAAGLAFSVSACSAAGTNSSVPPANAGSGAVTDSKTQVQPAVDMTSVLKMLTTQVVIGSTVDPNNGDQNPYGLAYVKAKPIGGGTLQKGDLVVCNFNNSSNVQGTGTTIEYMGSTPGSTAKTFVQSAQLKGCASLVLGPYDELYAPNSGAKNVTAISPRGKIDQTIKKPTIIEPWGSAYAVGYGYPPGDGVFVSDASSGKILRINLGTQKPKPTVTAVISGFAVNGGQPGNILGPSGLQYSQKTHTLFIVDGVNNTVVAVANAYNDLNTANSIVVGSGGKTFTGPKAKDARLVYSGSPLNGPISSTLLPNGNLVIGNTLDPAGKNLLVEIATNGSLLATKNVDTGAAGALFGIASVGGSDATTKIYFNDDNANNVQVLEK